MEQRIKDLMKKYKNEWLLVKVLEADELGRPVRDELILHSKSRDEIYEKQRNIKGDLYITYTGQIPKKGYAVAFCDQGNIGSIIVGNQEYIVKKL